MDYGELTKEELIRKLEAEQDARRALEASRGDAAGNERLLHELQVHQLELEAQNQALREAQGQIEESRSRYVDLYDFAPIAYSTFDRGGVVLEINLTGASMLGRERSRIVGKPFLALVRLDNPDTFVRHIRSSLESAIPVVSEITFSTERGAMEVQLVSAAVRSTFGPPTCTRTAFLDITQRRLAERELRAAHEAERVLRDRIEGIDRASTEVTAALARLSGPDIGAFLQVIVDQARELAGAEYAALGIGGAQGRPFDPWMFSGVSPAQAAAIGRTPRGIGLLGTVAQATRPVRLRDLREHGSFSGFPAHHPPMTSLLGVPIRYQGQVRGNLYLANKKGAGEFSEDDQTAIQLLADRVGTAMEIARLRQLEVREHARLEFLAKAGPLLAESIDYETTLAAIARVVVPTIADLSAIDLIEEDGTIRKLVAYHPERSKQELLDRLVGTTPPDEFWAGIHAAIETAEPQLRDLTHELQNKEVPDSTYRDILRQVGATCTILVPLLLRSRAVGVLRLVRAESGRKFTEQDLPLAAEIAHHAALAIEGARLYRAAQTAIRSRDSMLQVVSHDLRNYLSTIVMGGELLCRTGASPSGERRAGRKNVEAITRSAARMEHLIESLRDATMIEAGHFTIERQTEDVAELLEEAFKTLEPQAEGRSLHLSMELGEQLPAVACDRERVLQVITNLVGNAIKFSQAGGRIRIAARSAESTVRFSVSDTGSGMSAQQLAHVFDRYWKGRQGAHHGTGLGLFITKGIVEAHGGTIWVESEVGVGTTVFFTLSAMSPSADPPARRDRRAGEISPGSA